MRKALLSTIAVVMFAAVVPWSSQATSCTPGDWTMYGHDMRHTFAQSCSTIEQTNVSTLRPKWFVNTESPVTAQPAVVGGKVYVGTYGGTFYKVDAETGEVNWKYDVTDNTFNHYGKIVSSASVATVDGTQIVVFGGGATLYVLDTATGTKLAAACFDPNATSSTDICSDTTDEVTEIESSPAIVDVAGEKRILVGMDYDESDLVGPAGVASLRLDHSGSTWSLVPLWKFDPETGNTITTNVLKAGAGVGKGCGNVWSTPAIDQANDRVVFGVGNCDFPDQVADSKAEEIVAIKLSTGEKIWKYAPRDGATAQPLDLDFGSSAQILPDGSYGEGGKDGFYYKLNPSNGALAGTGWPAHVSTQSDIGGMIGSAAQGTVCFPSRVLPVSCENAIFASSAIPFGSRAENVQADFEDILTNDPRHAFALHAISASSGEKLWDSNPLPSYSAVTYTNGVLFVSDTFGFQFQAYNADNGALLWTFPTNGAPSSGPAIVGDSIYAGAGTSAPPAPLDNFGGIWAFQLATSVVPSV